MKRVSSPKDERSCLQTLWMQIKAVADIIGSTFVNEGNETKVMSQRNLQDPTAFEREWHLVQSVRDSVCSRAFCRSESSESARFHRGIDIKFDSRFSIREQAQWRHLTQVRMAKPCAYKRLPTPPTTRSTARPE